MQIYNVVVSVTWIIFIEFKINVRAFRYINFAVHFALQFLRYDHCALVVVLMKAS